MLENLALWCHRRRRFVIVGWLVVLVAAVVAAGAAGGEYATSSRLEGTDSDAAYQLFQKEFPTMAGDGGAVVFHDSRPGGISRDTADIEAYLASISSLPRVASVGSPFAPGGSISTDGTTASADIGFSEEGTSALTDTAHSMIERSADLRAAGVQTEFSGGWFQDVTVPSSEGFGLLAAAVILLLAFGSVVAMGLPVVTAVVGIMIGLAGVELWANALDTPDFTVQVASMVGIGVGIDYALFIVTRYREATTRHATAEAAILESFGTAGRAVAFAGCTVVISLLGMFLMGLPFLYGLAVGTASAVLVAVLAALTLLPALLGVLGKHLDRLSVHRRRRPITRETMWHRWSRLVQRRAVLFAGLGLAALLLVAAPVASMRLASADEGNDPLGTTTRAAYDLVAEGFGPGANGPLIVALETPDTPSVTEATQLASAIGSVEGVEYASAPMASESGRAAIVRVVPTTAPQSEATSDLVDRLRTGVLAESHLVSHVGGMTASSVDFARLMSDRLPVFIGAVLVLSFLLLMAVFRSVLVPLKAVVMNLLSIGAAYGVMVAVFQWGWLGSVFGVAQGAPIEPWAPMMLFAIVFGLSMDYEVFLLTSVQERFAQTGDNDAAVVEGLAATARVITAAAAIMVCVFGSFVVGDQRAIKLIGLGLAVAVLIDATVVRMVLVPATMQLLGRSNWWMPRALDRLLPRLTVERHTPASSVVTR